MVELGCGGGPSGLVGKTGFLRAKLDSIVSIVCTVPEGLQQEQWLTIMACYSARVKSFWGVNLTSGVEPQTSGTQFLAANSDARRC